MEENLKTIKSIHRLLIISCIAIISFFVLTDNKVNYYQSALKELDHIRNAFNEISNEYDSKLNKEYLKDKFVPSFISRYKKSIIKNLKVVSLIPLESAELNTKADNELNKIDKLLNIKVKKEMVKSYSVINENLKKYFDKNSIKKLKTAIYNYKNYLKIIENDNFIKIDTNENFPHLDKKLIKNRIIKSAKVVILINKEKKINKNNALIHFTLLDTINNKTFYTNKIMVKAKPIRITVNVDSILISKDLITFSKNDTLIFPKISKIIEEIGNLSFKNAKLKLEKLVVDWDIKNINKTSLYGINIVKNDLGISLSLLAILLISTYLFSTIDQLINNITDENKNMIIKYPWMGLHRHITGIILAHVSIEIFPILTLTTLVFFIKQAEFYFICAIIAITQILFCYKIFIKIKLLRVLLKN